LSFVQKDKKKNAEKRKRNDNERGGKGDTVT
jgi:hypothetical protein